MQTSVQVGDVLLNKYRVERVLGEGGMGYVLSARHLQLDELFAIKLMHKDALGALALGYLGRMADGRPDSCLDNFPAADLGRKYEATLVAFDWAGNASKEVSTTFEFADSEGSDCGCRIGGSSKSTELSAFFGGALAFLVFRRRRN